MERLGTAIPDAELPSPTQVDLLEGRLLRVDAVEKPSDEHGAHNDRIQANSCLNRRCVRDSSYESKLHVPTSQIVLQQHRSKRESLAISAMGRVTRT